MMKNLLFGALVFFTGAQVAAQCNCTQNITADDAGSYTVANGNTLCIDAGVEFTGSVTVATGGTVCNNGYFEGAITGLGGTFINNEEFVGTTVTLSGITFINEGEFFVDGFTTGTSVDITNNGTWISYSGTLASGASVTTSGDMTLGTTIVGIGVELHNTGALYIDGDLTVTQGGDVTTSCVITVDGNLTITIGSSVQGTGPDAGVSVSGIGILQGNYGTDGNVIDICVDGGDFTTINGAGTVGANVTICQGPASCGGSPLPGAVEADFEVDPEDGCVGDSFNFLNLSTGATSYAWTFPSGTPASSTDENPSVSFASAGRYMVKLVATDGTDSDSLEFEVEIFSNPTPTITEVSAGVLETETFDSYQWTLDGNDLNGEDSQSHTATADGSYTVTVTDMNGCSTTSAAYDYEEVTQTASVTEVNGNTLILYPNPSNGNITIEFGGAELRTIALFDASGRELSQWETNQSAFNANLDLNPGMYFVKVLSGSEEVVLSLVIK